MNLFDPALNDQRKKLKTIFVSSYVPTKCGIATFTKDITGALNNLNLNYSSEIIAVNGNDSKVFYPWEVKCIISKKNLRSYYLAAEYANRSSANVVCLQHEYGLFGGEGGSYLFGFLCLVKKPVITTLHTVLANPGKIEKFCLKKIADLSNCLVVMTLTAKRRLVKIYKINPNKIAVIHHGVNNGAKASKKYKKKYGWDNKKILLVSGLINRGKGIEQIIKALPSVIKKFPDTYLVIVGQTHPEILKNEGEKYRNNLIKLAKNLKVNKNLRFINKYLQLKNLLSYYEACDIFLTTHTDPEQTSSGTLAYALGMGKVCISTSYPYAKEMLNSHRGILVGFNNVEQTYKAIVKVFSNPSYEKLLSKNAYALGSKMQWPKVAKKYFNLFKLVKEINEKNKSKTSNLSN